MSQRPTSAELIEAVREFLEHEVQPQLEGSTGFHARVAVNVLRIVERELAQGETLDAEARARLAALLEGEGGPPSDASLEALEGQLLEAIRSGAMGVTTPGLVDHLRATIMGRLAVDNPRYGSYQRALGTEA